MRASNDMREMLARDVLREFRVVFGSIRRHFSEVEKACGISGAQLWALGAIVASPGMRVAELANALSVHQTTASNLVDRLVKGKLIARERGDADQRVVRLYPTARGRAAIGRAPGPVEGLLPAAIRRLPDDVIIRLKADLATLVAFLPRRKKGAEFQPLGQSAGLVARDDSAASVTRSRRPGVRTR
jgi:DNA-binding MarR family transcriptional regulator